MFGADLNGSAEGSGFAGEFRTGIAGQSLFGAASGGLVNHFQGGNFWEGAATGLIIGLLNHAGNKLSNLILNGGGDKGGKNKYKPKLQIFPKDFATRLLNGPLDGTNTSSLRLNYSGTTTFYTRVIKSWFVPNYKIPTLAKSIGYASSTLATINDTYTFGGIGLDMVFKTGGAGTISSTTLWGLGKLADSVKDGLMDMMLKYASSPDPKGFYLIRERTMYDLIPFSGNTSYHIYKATSGQYVGSHSMNDFGF